MPLHTVEFAICFVVISNDWLADHSLSLILLTMFDLYDFTCQCLCN